MIQPRLFSKQFLHGFGLLWLSTIPCVLSIVYPSVFASSIPLDFLALVIAARLFWKPSQRPFLDKTCLLMLSLGGILMFSSEPLGSYNRLVSNAGCWAFGWLSLFLALDLILPSLGISFGLIISPKAQNPPREEPERTEWLWTEAAYLGAVMAPIGEFMVFFFVIVAISIATQESSFHPSVKLDPAILVFFALIFAFASLAAWPLLWDRKAHAIIVRAGIPVRFTTGNTSVAMLAFCIWGIFIQVSYNTGRLLTWGLCCLLLALLITVLRKLHTGPSQAQEPASQLPSVPQLSKRILALQILILFLAISVYTSLALSAR